MLPRNSLAILTLLVGTAYISAGQPLAEIFVMSSSEQGPDVDVTRLLDGDLKSRWSSVFEDDQWVLLDLRQTSRLDRIRLRWEAACARDYELFVSHTQKEWHSVYSTTAGTGGVVDVDFAARPLRFVRLHMRKRATQWGNSLYEIELFAAGRKLVTKDTAVVRKVCTPDVLAVDVNQAFCAPRAPKQAVVRSNEKHQGGRYEVLDSLGSAVQSGDLSYWGTRWGLHFWVIDFSGVRDPGLYSVKAIFDGDHEAEAQITVGIEPIRAAAEKPLFYFRTQRCGAEIPGWHKLCHTDDGVLPDGTRIDASGGWHDCAGFDKEMYTTFLPIYFFTTMAADPALDWRAKMLEEARWGADWVVKMTDKSGYTWCHVDPHNLEPPQFIETWSNGTDTDNKIGTPDDRRITTNAWGPEDGVQAMNMGALAKLAWVLREDDPDYSRTLADTAQRMMGYLQSHDFVYADEIPLGKGNGHYAIFHAGMLLADIYLYRLTEEERYLQDARERIDVIIGQCQSRDGELLNSSIERAPVSGEGFDPYMGMVCFYDFCREFPDDPAVQRIKASYADFLDRHLPTVVGASPYGQAQVLDSTKYHYITVKTERRDFPKPSGAVSQGRNCYWLALATVCFLADDLLGTDRYGPIGARQIDWVVGQNPFGVSTVADVGREFPRMFTMWYWLKDHPASGGVIPGGVINGIGGDAEDKPALDMRTGNYLWWETNEYWNPPTAWFAMAAWQYYRWAQR